MEMALVFSSCHDMPNDWTLVLVDPRPKVGVVAVVGCALATIRAHLSDAALVWLLCFLQR